MSSARSEVVKHNFFAVVGLGMALVVLLIAVLVPALRQPRIKAGSLSREHLEVARRIMRKYDARIGLESDYRALVSDNDIELSQSLIQELLDNPESDLAVDGNTALDDYNQGMREFQKDLGSSGGRLNANTIRQGLSSFEQQLTDNIKLLERAQAAVDQAMAVQVGEVGMRQNASTNRLAGIIAYQKALAGWRRVMLERAQMATIRGEIERNGHMLGNAIQDQQLVEISGIDGHIATAVQHEAELRDRIVQQTAQIKLLQSQVAELQQGVDGAVSRSEAAREAMETLQDLGADLTDPNGYEAFRKAFDEQATNYRTAIRESHTLQYGTLSNAVIDYTGDYISGQYEAIDVAADIQPQRGLVHVQQDLETAEAELARMVTAATSLEENVANLRESKANFEQRAQVASAFVRDQRQAMSQAYSEYESAYERIRDASEQIISDLDDAIRLFKTAQQGVRDEQTEANDSKPQNSERTQYHYSQVAGDQRWLIGQLIAQEADAKLRQGIIALALYQDRVATLALQQTLSRADVAIDQQAIQQQADDQRAAFVKHVEDGIALLDNAKRSIGDGNWTVAAELGSANFLLSLADVQQAAEKALLWYDAALDGREGFDFATAHAAMRNYIRRQSSLSYAE